MLKADEALKKTIEERLELVVELLPSSEEDEEKEVKLMNFDSEFFI